MKSLTTIKHILNVLISIILVGLVVNCSDNSGDIIKSKIRDIEIKRGPIAEEVSEIRRNIESMKSRIQSKKNDYKELENDAYAYMWEHKKAVACISLGIGGVIVAFDDSDYFTPDGKIIGGVTSALASLYAINNIEEIITVADKLTQFNFSAENIKNEISSIESQIDKESKRLNTKWTELHLLNVSITKLRGENNSSLIDGVNFVVCVSNDTKNTLDFQYKWGDSSSWNDKSLEPGYCSWFWSQQYEKMNVKFDSNIEEWCEEKSYYLETFITDEEPECEIAKRYKFSEKNGSIDLYYIN